MLNNGSLIYRFNFKRKGGSTKLLINYINSGLVRFCNNLYELTYLINDKAVDIVPVSPQYVPPTLYCLGGNVKMLI